MYCEVCGSISINSELCESCWIIFHELCRLNWQREWASGMQNQNMGNIFEDMSLLRFSFRSRAFRHKMSQCVCLSSMSHPSHSALVVPPQKIITFSLHCLKYELLRAELGQCKFDFVKFRQDILPRMIDCRFRITDFEGCEIMTSFPDVKNSLEQDLDAITREVSRDKEYLQSIYPHLLMQSLLTTVLRLETSEKTSIIIEKSTGKVQGIKIRGSIRGHKRTSTFIYYREMTIPVEAIRECQQKINLFTGKTARVIKKHRSGIDRINTHRILAPAFPYELEEEGDELDNLVPSKVNEALLMWLKRTPTVELLKFRS